MHACLYHGCPWSTPLFYQRITEKKKKKKKKKGDWNDFLTLTMSGGVGTRTQASALVGGSPTTHPEPQINLMASLLSLL